MLDLLEDEILFDRQVLHRREESGQVMVIKFHFPCDELRIFELDGILFMIILRQLQRGVFDLLDDLDPLVLDQLEAVFFQGRTDLLDWEIIRTCRHNDFTQDDASHVETELGQLLPDHPDASWAHHVLDIERGGWCLLFFWSARCHTG